MMALRIRMALWVILVSLIARVASLRRAHAIAVCRVRARTAGDPLLAPANLARAIDGVLSVGLVVFRPSCWKRAIVLHRYLAMAGVDCRVCFGVRKNPDGTICGHAWLESAGRRLLERDAGEYTLTFSLPGSS